jgi:hypothetical protein
LNKLNQRCWFLFGLTFFLFCTDVQDAEKEKVLDWHENGRIEKITCKDGKIISYSMVLWHKKDQNK